MSLRARAQRISSAPELQIPGNTAAVSAPWMNFQNILRTIVVLRGWRAPFVRRSSWTGKSGRGGRGRHHDGASGGQHQGGLEDSQGLAPGGGRRYHQAVPRLHGTADGGAGGALRLPGFAGRAHPLQQGSHPPPRRSASGRGDQDGGQGPPQREDGRRVDDAGGTSQGVAAAGRRRRR